MQLATQNRSSQTLSHLKSLLCSNDKIPKICCSDLPDTKQEDDIKTHANINLLPNDCGNVKYTRLLGGYSLLNEFPWIVLIAYKVGHEFLFKCTGTLISPNYILTAAHCIKGKQIAGVRVGAENVNQKYQCREELCRYHYVDLRVVEAIHHEGYINYSTGLNDIGLLRLEKPADFSNDNAGAICLPLTKELQEMNTDNMNGMMAGWGSLDNLHRKYPQLVSQITIFPTNTCASYFERNTNDNGDDKFNNKLCGKEERNFLCDDRSGIPLLVETNYTGTYRYVQFGITSAIHSRQCDSLTPVIFTDVRKYINWILDTIKP